MPEDEFFTDENSPQQDLDDRNNDPTFRTRAAINNVQRPTTRKMSNAMNLVNRIDFCFLTSDPKNYDQAIKRKEKREWILAMEGKYDSLIKNETWILVERPENQNIAYNNRRVFKIKKNRDETIERYEARLVARRFTQKYGIDYLETSVR